MDTMEGSTIFLVTLLSLCVGLSEAWPSGTYSMVAPRTGCPSGFKVGWRYQDNEDAGTQNRITTEHHFQGFFFNDMISYYCSKTSSSGSGSWPRGNYCIMRYGSHCPSGFSSGSIYWDDEDTYNMNGKGGYLPSGSFDSDTRINYCCRCIDERVKLFHLGFFKYVHGTLNRSDGSSKSYISLPHTDPFYLMRYTSSCQRVHGMSVREEIIEMDDEDTMNSDSVSGSHPMESGSGNHRLYYCYYTPY